MAKSTTALGRRPWMVVENEFNDLPFAVTMAERVQIISCDYGQELTTTTCKRAKMNLAVRGISGNFGEVPADTFFKDQHLDLKADYIIANPPFNLKTSCAADELTEDSRWDGHETPPVNKDNYAWILHMVHD